MSAIPLLASQVMDFAAALLNDPFRTDYTYGAQLPYLNMAINELNEQLMEANVPITNKVSTIYKVKAGQNSIINLHIEMSEIQEVLERMQGTENKFMHLDRKEFPVDYPQTNSLLFWCWEDQSLKFNVKGANEPKDVKIDYVGWAMQHAVDEHTVIGTSTAATYLYNKTASLCAMFIGENETRAGLLDVQAEKAMERILAISNKGKQQIMTRHRPFRASYKLRGHA
jgi:hypothetical protein